MVTAFTGAALLGALAIAGVIAVDGGTVPDWLVALLSAGFGGGLIHTGAKIGGS